MNRTTFQAMGSMLLVFSAALASDTELDRATLRGLKAVKVVIDPIHPELEQQGLTTNTVQKQVEEQLRAAGVPVEADAREFLALRITPVREKKGSYGISMEAALYQPVQLARDKSINTISQTWETASLFIVPPKGVTEASRGTVRDIVERFVAAFQSVNGSAARAK